MNRSSYVLVSALALSLTGNIGWGKATDSALTPASRHLVMQQPAKEQTVSGRVTAVRDESFTVRVNLGEDTKTMEFATDGDTRIQGKLEVGAKARVTYRTENGKNMATQVIVLD